jgi:hypothetical protein
LPLTAATRLDVDEIITPIGKGPDSGGLEPLPQRFGPGADDMTR